MTATKSLKSIISRALFKRVSIAPLIIFRIIFGALLLYGSVRFVSKGWVKSLYIDPEFYFGYLGFEWVHTLPGNWMYLPFILMIISSLLIVFGLGYRVAAFTFFLSFTYVELLDKSNYLNHYYFVSLMSFLLIFLPANRDFSLDVLLKPSIKQKTTAAWTIGILKFQLAVVYIFAGLAKINYDWLVRAEPLKTWLHAHHTRPLVGDILRNEVTAYVFSWFGCIYDLFIVFFLMMRKTRMLAYLAVIIFHITTWLLFPIGVFPWVMIFSTLIFFSEGFHQKILFRLKKMFGSKEKKNSRVIKHKKQLLPKGLKTGLITTYVLIQLLVPMRYILYPGHLYWNEEGFRFSWRVMLMHKEGHAVFYMKDRKTGRTSEINNANYLTRTQEDQMATQPDMILQYASYLAEQFDGKTLHYGEQKFKIENPAIHAEIYVSLNGRPSKLFVDKRHDLTQKKYNLYHRNWIEPYHDK
ncbi:MAG: HTTM domain-containing protein [Fluviicola sp.]|nr:MAG: HTTM domain-containing protein [Fluviicola sp.]